MKCVFVCPQVVSIAVLNVWAVFRTHRWSPLSCASQVWRSSAAAVMSPCRAPLPCWRITFPRSEAITPRWLTCESTHVCVCVDPQYWEFRDRICIKFHMIWGFPKKNLCIWQSEFSGWFGRKVNRRHLCVFFRVQLMQYVIYGIASFFFLYGIILLAEGFYTTSAVKELHSEFKTTICGRCISGMVQDVSFFPLNTEHNLRIQCTNFNEEIHLWFTQLSIILVVSIPTKLDWNQDGHANIMKCVYFQFVFLTYILGITWLGVFGFSAVPVFLFYNIWSTCVAVGSPLANQTSICVDMRQYGTLVP